MREGGFNFYLIKTFNSATAFFKKNRASGTSGSNLFEVACDK